MVICLAPSVYADDDAVLIPLRAADRSSSSSSHHTAHQRRQKLSTEDLLWQRTALLPLELAPDENCIVCKGSQSTTDWGGKKRTQNSSKAILYYIQHGHICLPSVRSLLCFWGFVSDFQWAAHQRPFTLSTNSRRKPWRYWIFFALSLFFVCASPSKVSKIWKGRHCQKSSLILYYMDSAVV